MPVQAPTCSSETISAFLLDRYGPLLDREAIRQVLGFPTPEALERHMQRGHLKLKLVHMPHRRGFFALVPDVVNYLMESSVVQVVDVEKEGGKVSGKKD
jgi:hypothetical protein